MTIDKVGPPEPIKPVKKQGSNDRVNDNLSSDSITLSSEALKKGEFYQAVELVSAAPDARMDRIAELRRKINDPSYINDTVLQGTADKIIEAFGLWQIEAFGL